MSIRIAVIWSVGAAALVLALPAGAWPRVRTTAPAHAARSLRATDRAELHYNARQSEGSLLIEEGSATGALPGRMIAHLTTSPTAFGGSFLLILHGGTIRGHGAAKPSGSGRYESFRGTLSVTGGSGLYAHAHGQAGLYGVYDRSTYKVTIQTTGQLSY